MPEKPRLIPYVDEETGTHLHLRIDPSGYGALVIGASKVVYLNRTAAFFVECWLKGMSPEEAAKRAVKKFKWVTREQAMRDYKDVIYRIRSLIRTGACPISSLGFERLNPFTVELRAPYRVDLALTYRCNNRCIHCYSASPREKPELSTGEWKRVIDRLFSIGVPNITFTGGEPTLREDLVELIAYAQSKGLVTGLVTNGRLLSKPGYAKKLEEAGLDYVQITLESSRPDVHDRLTGVKGSWAETVEGIKNALKTGVYLDVNMTLNKLNYDHVEEYVEFLAGLGVRRVSANRIILSGRAPDVYRELALTLEEEASALEALVESAAEHGLEFRWYGVTRYCELNPFEFGLDAKFCSACYTTMAIEPDGTVIPCQSYYEPLGNILRDPWEKIWNSDLCRWIRERKYAGEPCRSCELFRLCGGGCPLEAKYRPYEPRKLPRGL